MAMTLSTQVRRLSLATTADDVVRLERAGVDMVWVGEAEGNDSISVLGYLAARTTRVRLGAGVLSVYSRTPALIAQTAATLAQLSGGRFALGLGSSGPQVVEGWHGVPFVEPLRRTTETIEICRAVWTGEKLDYAGRVHRLPLPKDQGLGLGKSLRLALRPVPPPIPVYVAALGPANVRMTARLADGWLPHLFLPERARDVWAEPLAAGRAERAPDQPPLDVVAGGVVAIGPGAPEVRQSLREPIARFVGGMGAVGKNFYFDLACRYGFTDAARKVQEHFLAGRKADAAAAVPDELLDAMGICGDEAYVKDRIAAYAEAGVTNLVVNPAGPEPHRVVERVRELLP